MTFSPEFRLLTLTVIATLLMWIPYMLARIMTRGLMAAFDNPDPSGPPDPAWAERARRAHGRDAFYIHGDSVRRPGTASEGCIILGPDIRARIWASGDRVLQVIE